MLKLCGLLKVQVGPITNMKIMEEILDRLSFAVYLCVEAGC